MLAEPGVERSGFQKLVLYIEQKCNGGFCKSDCTVAAAVSLLLMN